MHRKNVLCRLLPLGALCLLLWSPPALAANRALLVGIGDYSATAITGPQGPVAPATATWPRRSIASLPGPPNDLVIVRTLLEERYGFAPHEIRVLADGAATRRAILEGIQQHLGEGTTEGDQVVFYFSGHGSQRYNSASPEEDHLDETFVPADSLLGADDIRDKELQRLFNKVLDTGAQLTVILDSCHSGSGTRGLRDELAVRQIHVDPRDANDAGPEARSNKTVAAELAPEFRGALVFSATSDSGVARESWDEQEKAAGAFTRALQRSISGAAPQESAADIFQRVRARLHVQRPAQMPTLSGSLAAKRSPLFGGRPGLAGSSPLQRQLRVAVEEVERSGEGVLAGGRVHGLTVGTILALAGSVGDAPQEEGRKDSQGENKDSGREALRLEVKELRGLTQAVVRPTLESRGRPRSGDLLRVVRWAAPPGESLRVWIPTADGAADGATAMAVGERLRSALGGLLIADPTAETPAGPPTHTLRWFQGSWQLLGPGGTKLLGVDPDARTMLAEVSKVEQPRVFLQMPVPKNLAAQLEMGPGSRFSLVEPTEDPRRADYVLVGRWGPRGLDKGLEFAWVRPGLSESDPLPTSLPIRSRWLPWNSSLTPLADELSSAASRLALVHRWLTLEAPPRKGDFPYRFAIRPTGGTTAVENGDFLPHGNWYDLVLETEAPPRWNEVRTRHVYVFALDSHGKGQLMFPNPNLGGVENLLPVAPFVAQNGPQKDRDDLRAAQTLVLGPAGGAFCSRAPYGTDTFFLLTSGVALPDPGIFNFGGVRGPERTPTSPLEKLLLKMGSSGRGESVSVATTWSLESLTFSTVAPEKPLPLGVDLCRSTAQATLEIH